MMMTQDETLINVTTDKLVERKQELESGLAAASMHGVEAPPDLLAELENIQTELARRLNESR